MAGRAGLTSNGAVLATDARQGVGRAGLEGGRWRARTLILGVVLACVVSLAVATAPTSTSPSTREPGYRGRVHRHAATRLPASLAPTVSASIGASDHRFWLAHRVGSLVTTGGGIHSTFTRSGAALRADQGTVGLSLAAFGRGQSLARLLPVAPTATANRVLYRHGSVGEFYRNGPYGLEQGFTVSTRPRAGSGPLVLAVRVTGSLRPEKVGSQILFRTKSSVTALRYGQLSALDATGRRLPAHLQIRKGSLELLIDDRNARYPLRIDPFVEQDNDGSTSDESNYEYFGWSVALSADGSTAVVGAPWDNEKSGAAWVFTRSGSTWTQQGNKLTGSGETGNAGFGWSVAVSSNGSTAVIGGPWDAEGIGAVWVFTRSGSTWTQQGSKLKGSGESGNADFGSSVAVSSEGTTALIGGPADASSVGAAWVFTRSGSTWTQQGSKLKGSGESGNADFGSSVAVSSEGTTALIGGPTDASSVGAAWVFTRSGSTWTQQGSKLTGTGESGEGAFGSSVALSGEGTTALIGGRGDAASVGAAWVFTRSGSTWTQQGSKLTGSGETYAAEFGSTVALSSEGSTALVGGADDGTYGRGAAWVFTRSGSTWTQQGEKLTSSEEGGYYDNGEFGFAVALSGDGNTALIGGPNAVAKGAGGGAWVFTRSGEAWAQQGGELTGTGETAGNEGGFSVAVSADGTIALLGAPHDGKNWAGGVWVFVFEGRYWRTAERLTPTGESGGGEFGYSVALSPDASTALIGAPADNGSVGAAWVFTRSGSTWTQQGSKLTGSGESGGGRFGSSVAVSSEGSRAVVGAPADASSVGAAWMFTRSGSTWTQQGSKLKGSGESGAGAFGTSVALSSEGTTALIGGPADASSVGAVWAFTRSGSTWTQQGAKLTGSGESGAGALGWSVALSADGSTALAGAPKDNGSTGAVWTFTRAGSTWSQSGGKLTGEYPESNSEFGYSTAVSGDASTAGVGAPHYAVLGVAFAFSHSGSTWSETRELAENEGYIYYFEPDLYGASVALSPNGNFLVIGAPRATQFYGGALFAREQPLPTVETGPASSVAQTSAVVEGSVDPNSGEEYEEVGCQVEYGSSETYGSYAACSPTVVAGTTPEAITAALKGLLPNATYHYRIRGYNRGGNGYGADHTFTTLPAAPTVVTGSASSVTQTSATLDASVNPNGASVTSCSLEYGPSLPSGTSVPCSPSPGSGRTSVSVFGAVSGLSANSSYQYRVVATNAGGTSTGSTQSFTTPPNAPTVATEGSSSVTQTNANLEATVNPNGVEVSSCVIEYGASLPSGTSVSCSPPPGSGTSAVTVSGAVSGLAANTSYQYRVIATNAGGTSTGGTQGFTTQPDPPTVVTEAASSITQTAATLNATVNPNGGNVTECKLEYGTSLPSGTSVPCSPSAGSGTSAVSVSGAVASLTANTSYQFRVIATNAGGTSTGATQSFTTVSNPPTVVTGGTSAVTHTGATLEASVNPNGGEVSDCHFEYGTSVSYGTSVPCGSPPGSGESPAAVSAAVSGLVEGVTYHYRISATNPGGVAQGGDETFATATPGAPEFGRCVKVPAEKENGKTVYHGWFTAATCLVKSTTRISKYEWVPGVVKAGFKTAIKPATTATLETVKKAKVTCTSETSTGTITSPKTVGNVTIRFTGCESATKKCTTSGLGEGELETKQLEGVLGIERVTVKEGKETRYVALDLYPPGKTGPFIEYTCVGGTPVTLTGSLISPVPADKTFTTGTVKYAETSGKQKPERFEGGEKDVLTNGLSEQVGLKVTGTQTNEEPFEMNAII